MTELNYTAELGKIDNLIEDLKGSDDVIRSVSAWYDVLKPYFNSNETIGLEDEGKTMKQWGLGGGGGGLPGVGRLGVSLPCW